MRNEAHFGPTGFYWFMVSHNILLHQECVQTGGRILDAWIGAHASTAPLRVLDLACGGEPVAIAALMEQFPAHVFEYTGVDIHADQAQQARSTFRWPANVHGTICEGNAWELQTLPLPGPFEIVFSGLNFHHGTPEELAFVGRALLTVMPRGGILLSHDLFRPSAIPYRRRPDRDAQSTAPFSLVSPADMVAAGIPARRLPGENSEPRDWREDLIAKLDQEIRRHGGDDVGREMNHAHIRARDFPVSAPELATILTEIGFETHVYDYEQSGHPMQEYFAMIAAYKL